MEPISYTIGHGRNAERVTIREPLSEEEMKRLELSAEERLDAMRDPHFVDACRQRLREMEPKAPEPAAATAPPMVPVATEEWVSANFHTVPEIKALVKQVMKAIAKTHGKVIRENVQQPIHKRLDSLEEKTSSLADAQRVAELSNRIEGLEQIVAEQAKQITQLQRQLKVPLSVPVPAHLPIEDLS